MEKKIRFPHILILALFASFTIILNPQNEITKIGERKFLAPPPERIEYFHFGFRESMADSFWLRWIQDSDFCQTYLTPPKIVETTLHADDDLIQNPRHRICDQSWGFKMLDTVTKLAPKFQMPYTAGAITLSVLIEDYEGASVIFDRGIDQYPNDWSLLYRAAYHFLYDKQDLPKAAGLLQRAAAAGAPEWVNSLAARLYTKSGQIELGIQALENYLKSIEGQNPDADKEVKERIADLRVKLSQQ